jgi:hypothetical protein
MGEAKPRIVWFALDAHSLINLICNICSRPTWYAFARTFARGRAALHPVRPDVAAILPWGERIPSLCWAGGDGKGVPKTRKSRDLSALTLSRQRRSLAWQQCIHYSAEGPKLG